MYSRARDIQKIRSLQAAGKRLEKFTYSRYSTASKVSKSIFFFSSELGFFGGFFSFSFSFQGPLDADCG